MNRYFYIYFWHNFDEAEANDIASMFEKAVSRSGDSFHGPHIKVAAPIEPVAELLMGRGYNVWFKSDRETVFITKEANFGQRG